MWIRKPEKPLVVVFLHGILSDGQCWKHANGTYWPSLLASEPETNGAGIFVFEYRTGLFSGTYSLSDAVDTLKATLDLEGILNACRVVFVCHSMGGIVARSFVVRNEVLLAARRLEIAFFLIASPSLGSGYANWISPIARFFKHTQEEVLRFSQTNIWLNQLDHDFIDLRERNAVVVRGRELIEDSFIILRRAILRQVVPPFSGARYFGDSIKIANSDHFTIAKVPNADALQHRLLVKFIRDLGHIAASGESSHANHPLVGDAGSEAIPANKEKTSSQVNLDRVPKFRDAIMDPAEINDLIAAAETRFHVSIEGISGSGKTYLAAAVIQAGAARLGVQRVIWFHFSGDETLDELIEFIEGFEVASTWSQAARTRALMMWLTSNRTLLVLDDAHLADQDCRAALVDAASAPDGACRLLTISQRLVTAEKSGRDVRRFTPVGFNGDKIRRVMEMRDLPPLSMRQLDLLVVSTDGLPFAVCLFATLIKDFGHNADALLRDRMSTDERLLDWCHRALGHVAREERELIKGLSLIDGVIDRQLAESVAAALNVKRFEATFEKVLSWHLLRRDASYTWTMHRILAEFCNSRISPVVRKVVARELSNVHRHRETVARRNSSSTGSLNETASAIRYLVVADEIENAGQIISRFAAMAKEKGAFGLLKGLIDQTYKGSVVINTPPWVAYHYGHALHALGKTFEANNFLSEFLNRKNIRPRAAAFSAGRLLAETFLDLRNPERARDVLEQMAPLIEQSKPSSTALQQYWCARARAALDLGQQKLAEQSINVVLLHADNSADFRAKPVIEMHLSLLAQSRGELALSRELAESANEAFVAAADPRGMLWAGVHIGGLDIALGQTATGVRRILELIRGNGQNEFSTNSNTLRIALDHVSGSDRQLLEYEIRRCDPRSVQARTRVLSSERGNC